MHDDEPTVDSSLVAAALEHPMSRYLDWAEREDVKKALAMFKSEREIRKTGRLDLVTWVQYICGFGYLGPTDEAWAHLFAACRVLPMLNPLPNNLLREHEIAVLLAYAKIKPDHGDTMTHAQLVKHRIKPAVLGRTVARTPGILTHIHAKFEHWALGPFTDMFCWYCVSLCGPSSYMPGIDDLPTTQSDIGDSIRECADAHAIRLLKTWGTVVSNVLDLDIHATTQRAARFEKKLHEKRKFMYQHIFIKISEYWFNLTQSRASVPQDRDSLHYRQMSYSEHSGNERLLVAKSEVYDARLSSFVRKLISRSPVHATYPSWCTVKTRLTICEIHKPSRYGQAGLDFVQSDDIRKNVVKLRATDVGASFTPSKTNIRIGCFNSNTLTAEVHGVPPSQMCRALCLELSVRVLSPKSGCSRPRFEITNINHATWVELGREEDECVEIEPMSELGMEHDEKDDEDAQDRLHQWFCSSGIGKHLGLGAGVHITTFDLCEGMTKHMMEIEVPEEVLRRLRVEGKVSEQTRVGGRMELNERESPDSTTFGSCSSIDLDVDMGGGGGGVERFQEPCWIDCHTAAQMTYIAPPGVELYAASPGKRGIFANAPFWKSRAP